MEPRGVRANALFYCHDTFGLGRFRRAVSVAAALTYFRPGLTALVSTGSPLTHAFRFPDGIAHADVRLLQAPVSYLPESLAGLVGAQTAAMRRRPRRCLRLLAEVLRRRCLAALEQFLQAGAIAGARPGDPARPRSVRHRRDVGRTAPARPARRLLQLRRAREGHFAWQGGRRVISGVGRGRW